MSVRVGDRNESRIEFLYQADKLYDEIFLLTSRYFGIYSKHSPFRPKYSQFIRYRDSDEIDNFIKKQANELEELASELRRLLVSAKSIYPKSKIEYERRLSYISSSLACANSIKTTLNSVVQYFDLDINIFKNVILILNNEINLIKRLRTSDRKRFGHFL